MPTSTITPPHVALAPRPHERAVVDRFLAARQGDRRKLAYGVALVDFALLLRRRHAELVGPLIENGRVWAVNAAGDVSFGTAEGAKRRKADLPRLGGREVRLHGGRLPGVSFADLETAGVDR